MLPIAIEEYGEPSEVGVPGPLVGCIAKFERAGVQIACADGLTRSRSSPPSSFRPDLAHDYGS